jgi:hypothetical protein
VGLQGERARQQHLPDAHGTGAGAARGPASGGLFWPQGRTSVSQPPCICSAAEVAPCSVIALNQLCAYACLQQHHAHTHAYETQQTISDSPSLLYVILQRCAWHSVRLLTAGGAQQRCHCVQQRWHQHPRQPPLYICNRRQQGGSCGLPHAVLPVSDMRCHCSKAMYGA